MVYYFSGTGNSKWVAEQVAKGIGEESADIALLMKQGRKPTPLLENEKLGIVFPVYAWEAPEMVLEFVKKIKREPNTYTFAICTCGDEAGYTIEKLQKVIPLNSGYSIVMPNNYIIGFDVDKEEMAIAKLEKAKMKVAEIIENIKNKEPIFEIDKGKLPYIKSHAGSWFFNQFGRSTKAFIAEEGCNGCGLCEQQCPSSNIEMVEGKPKWNKQCTMCMGCINRCPNNVIQYGRGTKKKGRYYLEMFYK